MGVMSNGFAKGSFGGHAIFQYINTAVTMISGLVFYLLIVRIFDRSTVGTISLLNSITGLFSMIFAMGLQSGLQHYISYFIGKDDFSKVKGMISRFLVLIVLIAAMSFVFLYFSAPYISYVFFHDYSDTILLRLLGLNLSAFIVISLFNSIMLGLQSFKRSAVLMIFGSLATYSTALLLLFVSESPSMIVIGWGIGNVVDAAVFAFAIMLIMKSMALPKGERIAFKPVFSYSFPVFLAAIISFGANYTDRFAVAFFLNLSYVGIYNIAMLVGTSLLFLVVPINNMLLPKFSELFSRTGVKEVRDNVRRSVNFITFFFTPIALLLAAMSQSVMEFLGGVDYLGGSLPLSIMVISYALFVSSNVLVQGLSSTRHTSVLIVSSAVPLFTNIVLSIILIPRFLLVGASLALGLTALADFIVVYYYSRKFDLSNFDFRTISKLWFSSIVMFVMVSYLQNMLGYSIPNVILYIASGTLVYLVLNKLLHAVNPSDLEYVFSIMPVRLNFIKNVLRKLFIS